MPIPHIKTKPPGPKARAVIAQDQQYTAPAYGRVYPLVVKQGRGVIIEDVDDNRYLDFNAGIAVAATGHSHPQVVAAIKEQAEKFLHFCGSDFYYEPMARLAERLCLLAPGSSAKRIFFTNSGTEAIEAALKLARYATRRHNVVAFLGSFHGRTFGALSLGASRSLHRAHFGPLVPGVHHLPFGDIDAFEVLFRHQVAPDEIAAVFVEPIQGEGGYVVPPREFLPRVKEVCARHGIVLVADEIQSGLGRSGKLFACEHFGVEPDIVCVAKGIASGLPLGAMIARSDISTWPAGAHGSTFGGNPVACAAALATLDLLQNGLVQNAAEVGDYLKSKLTRLTDKTRAIADVRGLGLMIGVELAPTDGTPASAAGLRDQVIRRAFENGLLLLGCGTATIRFSPPLIVEKSHCDTAVEIFEETLSRLTRS
ncbi:MAG TPA: acetyl ornithine aminotransferase family protein [Candidatus Acidoferrales bacterium]|nr:acetyl ornithine aminotransferase family protein [Candidatus Acidoferrales bacterium]